VLLVRKRKRPLDVSGRGARVEREIALAGEGGVATGKHAKLAVALVAVRRQVESRAGVVREDVDELGSTGTGGLFEPRRDCQVLLRALAPRQPRVRSVAHEDVREPELRLTGDGRLGYGFDVAPAPKALEGELHFLLRSLPDCRNGADPERASHHRCVADDGSL